MASAAESEWNQEGLERKPQPQLDPGGAYGISILFSRESDAASNSREFLVLRHSAHHIFIQLLVGTAFLLVSSSRGVTPFSLPKSSIEFAEKLL